MEVFLFDTQLNVNYLKAYTVGTFTINAVLE